MKKILLISLIFLNLTCVLYSQVTFEASANKLVKVGERFRIDFNVNANASGFRAPSLGKFRVLMGPSSETSTSIRIINGKTTQSITTSYSYVVQAVSEGKFTIGSAQVNVDGKIYKSSPITIEVLKGNAQATNPNSNQGTAKTSQQSSGGNVFIKVNLSKTKVYQGEQITSTIKIYDKIGQLAGLPDYKLPSYSGFWSQDVNTPNRLSLTREKYNNQIYYSALVCQHILFPQKNGTITIEPCVIECIIREKAGQRRNFFGEKVDVYQNVAKTLKSAPRKVTVLPLPPNKPASFTGGVGKNFKFKMSVDRTELKSNESITLKLLVSGNGNIKIVDKINIDFPLSFDVFDPKVSSDINSSASGARGSKTFEYLVIPREPGEYTIPATKFSYFDVKSETYKTLTTDAIKFTVKKGDNSSASVSQATVIDKEIVQNSGSDIRHIITKKFALEKENTKYYGSLWFYLSYLIAIILFVLAIIIISKNIKRNKNIVLQKNKRANKISRQRLKEAEKYMKENNKEAFYTEVINALWGFLSDKLNIPISELSRNTVKETLERNNVEEKLIEEFVTTIDNCEFAKYAPNGGEEQISEDYDKARLTINALIERLS